MSISLPTRGRGRGKATLNFIEACLEILRAEQPTSVRAVAYRLFTRGLIPDMGKKSTDKVSRMLTIGREDGLIPWGWIVDETRTPKRAQTWSSPDEIIQAAVYGYRLNYWKVQPAWVEVWSEKATLNGVLGPVLDKYGVTFRVNHGYGSATSAYSAAVETRRAGKPLNIFYVGDWDPSGMDMSERDTPGRLERYGGQASVERIALVPDDLPNLPSFPAEDKKKDPRYPWFVRNYGDTCWELDAMDSNLVRDRVEGAIRSMIDFDLWDRAIEVERAEVASMQQFHNEWKARLEAGYD